MDNVNKETDMTNIFKDIYDKKLNNDKNEFNNPYLNDYGSGLYFNKEYILFLKEFIKDNNTNVIVDLGCGDFTIGMDVCKDLNVMYNGFDVYKDIIDYHNSITKKLSLFWSFHYLDFYNEKEKIPFGDLCIIKDVFQHWNNDCTYKFLDYLIKSKKFKYILICNCSYQESDRNLSTGLFRPLNNKFYPLNQFKLTKIFNYATKDVYLYKSE